MTIGQRIRKWRQVRGMTQKQLAELVGVRQSAVSFWEGEGGQKNNPELENLEKVVSALRLSMEKFYGPIPGDRKRRAIPGDRKRRAIPGDRKRRAT